MPVGAASARLVRWLVVVPAGWLWTCAEFPALRGLWWLVRGLGPVLLVRPAAGLWRWVLTPAGRVLAFLGREAAAALGHAWRVAGHVSRAVGRCVATVFRWLVAAPCAWAHRTVLAPRGHAVRDGVLRPAGRAARAAGRSVRQACSAARDTVRQVRADLRRARFRGPRQEPVADRRVRTAGRARTLEGSTTALTKD